VAATILGTGCFFREWLIGSRTITGFLFFSALPFRDSEMGTDARFDAVLKFVM
jgi:hypothetical protein